ncbi:MAG: cyclic pyranopterin monophosphate synthase MoaC [Armatimonadota bacterium]
MSNPLSHVDDQGQARMVDVSAKPETRRVAVAEGRVRMQPETAELIRQNRIAKGDVLTVAKVAGVMASKQTSALIPMCHPLPLSDLQLELELEADRVEIRATAVTVGRTGVEMEALTAVSVAALTLYDMCKAVDRGMVLDGIRLVSKTGGKSDWSAESAETSGENS